jgi:two-component SAPR family response regulator
LKYRQRAILKKNLLQFAENVKMLFILVVGRRIKTCKKKRNAMQLIKFALFATNQRRIKMIKKSMNAMNGIKATTQLYETKIKKSKHRATIDTQDKVDNCLSCTKPANKCKGNCYGKY